MSVLADLDLDFLKDVPDEGIKRLLDLLVYDNKDGKRRRSESISNTKLYNDCERDKKWSPMVNEIIHELQCFGGDTIINTMRGGRGVCYKEILCDICDKLKINYDKKDSAASIELELLRKGIFDSLKKRQDHEIDDTLEDLGIKANAEATKEEKIDLIREFVNNRETRLKAYHQLVSLGSYNVESVKGNLAKELVKLGLIGVGSSELAKVGAKQVFKRFAGAFVPGMQILLGFWTAIDLIPMWTGPAFRVTIPCAILIAVLREECWAAQKNK